MEIKKCPFCSEEILSTAKKCKHCGEMVEETSNPIAKEEFFISKDKKILQEIVDSVNEAIIHRG
jgi:hypothetical protein